MAVSTLFASIDSFTVSPHSTNGRQFVCHSDCARDIPTGQVHPQCIVIYPEFSAPSWLILGLRPANERRRYFVTTSPIGWAQAKLQPCNLVIPQSVTGWTHHINAGLVLGLRQANGRRRYFVTTSLIRWAQAWNQSCKWLKLSLGGHASYPTDSPLATRLGTVKLSIATAVHSCSRISTTVALLGIYTWIFD